MEETDWSLRYILCPDTVGLERCPRVCYYQVFWEKTLAFCYAIPFSPMHCLQKANCSDLTDFSHTRVHDKVSLKEDLTRTGSED